MNSTETHAPTLVMSGAYAYDVLIELEAVDRVLAPFDEPAGRGGDADVLALRARVLEAIQIATRMQAERPTPERTPPARHARKGVRLAKN